MADQIARTPKQMGEALRRRRRHLGLQQKALGEVAGLRQATISRLEAGEAGLRLSTLFEVLTALEMELVIRPRTKVPIDVEELF